MTQSNAFADDGIESNIPPIAMEPAVVREPPKPTRDLKRGEVIFSDDRIIISLEHGDEVPPTGLFVGLNGVGWLLKPNVPCPVVAGIVEILDHAVGSKPVQDPQTLQVVGYQDRLRFPYRVLGHLKAGEPFKMPEAA